MTSTSDGTDSRRALRRVSGAYFLYFAAFGLLVPYFPSYLLAKGMTTAEVGLVLVLGPMMRIVFPPVVGLLADRGSGPKLWNALLAWAAAAGLVMLAFSQTDLLTWLAIAGYFVACAPAISLLDSAAIQQIVTGRSRFGRVRLWGSVGFVVTSFGLGSLVPDLPATAIISSLVVTSLLFALFVSIFPVGDAPPEPPRYGQLPKLFRSPVILLLIATILLNRMSSAPFYAFYTVFVQESGFGGGVVAATWALAIVAEISVMVVVDRAIDRVGSAWVLAVGVGLETFRWFVYAYAASKWALLAVAPAHGIAFATIYIASVRSLDALVPREFRTLGQSINAVSGGVGQMIGFALAGALYATSGGPHVFLLSGFVGLGATLSAIALSLLEVGRTNRPARGPRLARTG